MKILIIPDVHGEAFWKKQIYEITENLTASEETVLSTIGKIVFLGDYVDSFFINDVDMKRNLLEIIELKKRYSNVVTLLLGNHDLSYIDPTIFGCSGFRQSMYLDLHNIFKENRDLFQLTYHIKINTVDYLFSHGGITKTWYNKHEELIDKQDGSTLSEKLNKLWNSDKGMNILSEVSIYSGGPYGKSSPIWTRPEEWDKGSAFYGYHQIVGHTPQKELRSFTFDNGLQEAIVSFLDRSSHKHPYWLENGVIVPIVEQSTVAA